MNTLCKPRVLGTLLLLSLAANLFLAGTLAGRFSAAMRLPPPMARDFEASLRALPEERREQLRSHFRAHMPEIRRQHRALRGLHEALGAELERSQPDRARLEQLLGEIRTRGATAQQALQTSFLDTVLELPASERRVVIEHLLRRSGPRPPPPGERAPPPPGPPPPGD